jgi:hypothetical protein
MVILGRNVEYRIFMTLLSSHCFAVGRNIVKYLAAWKVHIFKFPKFVLAAACVPFHVLYYTKNQQDATLAVLFISNCKIALHISDAFCFHHQEYLKLY